MSNLKRNFARRHITWKISNLTPIQAAKYASDESIASKKFDLFLGTKKTQWSVSLVPEEEKGEKSFGCYLKPANPIVEKCSIDFTVSIRNGNECAHLKALRKKSSEFTKSWGWSNVITIDTLLHEKDVLVFNTLTLELELEILEDSKVTPYPSVSFSRNLENLLDDEKLSDFVFDCSDGEKVHVVKAIISCQSPVFAAMLKPESKESQENVAKIDDIESTTMLELLRFIYCGKVENLEELDYELLIAANKYGINELKDICVSSLMENFEQVGFLKVFLLADLLDIDDLRDNVISYIKCKYLRIKDDEEWKDLNKDQVKKIMDSMGENPISINLVNVLA